MSEAPATVLSELELDALTELVNIGVSRAATNLRDMVGQQVLLSVPNVVLVSREEAVRILVEREDGKLVAVHQVFEGDITGRALLIFPETNSLELVRAVTGGELPLEDIIELEQEALAETGNIILNGCLSTIANMLERNLKMSLPEILRGDSLALFNLAPPPEPGDIVMFLYINFAVRQGDISGYIAMLLDMPSLAAMKLLLGEFIERTTGGTTHKKMQDTELGAIADALDIGVIVLDRDRQVTGWNQWLAAASGLPSGRVRGRSLPAIFEGAFLRRLDSAIGEALNSGASSLLTHSLHPQLFPLKTRTGQRLIHDVFVRPIGTKPYVACVIQISDVTVATRRERVLRERQNARYAAVVDNAQDAILTIDADGVIQLANAAAGREFGTRPADLVGRPICELLEDRAAWEQIWRAAMGGQAMLRPVELVSRRRDGSAGYLEVSASRWLSESRVFVSVILRDVSERHATEAALRRLNETLEDRVATTLAERQLLADIVEDTDALVQALDQEFRIIAVNRAAALEFERIYGKTPEIGDNLLDLLADLPREQASVKALWTRALAGEAFSHVEQLGNPGLDRRFYELKFNALRDADGRQFAAFQFVYDVTERLERQEQLARTEEALRQSQKMEAIGQLTGGIAHDFNNLLTGIIGSMDILKRRIALGRYDEVQRFMDAASNSATRAAALTHRLLAFARRQPLDPKGVDINTLVRGMEDLLCRTLGEQVGLTTDLAPDAWHTLSDANQLENAVLNLAINARDAMPNGGRLTISTSNVHFDTTTLLGEDEIEAGDYALIRVADSGVGMAPDVIPKVFDPFFTTKPLGAGTGLGLSMIYGFARQSRGHVRIESTVGRGTDVMLYLPRYRGELEDEGLRQSPELPAGEGETVLLVEDDSSVRLLIGEVLRELGYSCIEAIDGQAALAVLGSNTRLDLMISDIGLPGLNGRQLATTAREHRPELKILFVTGYAHHAAGGDQMLEPGMAMVTKPFSLDALALKIRDMLAPAKS